VIILELLLMWPCILPSWPFKSLKACQREELERPLCGQLLTFLLGAHPCMQPVLTESLEGLIHNTMLRYILTPWWRDGILHHHMFLQVFSCIAAHPQILHLETPPTLLHECAPPSLEHAHPPKDPVRSMMLPLAPSGHCDECPSSISEDVRSMQLIEDL
jgi:hypothetical protein